MSVLVFFMNRPNLTRWPVKKRDLTQADTQPDFYKQRYRFL